MRALILMAGLAAVLGAGPARAFDLPAKAEAQLERGRPWVEVREDADGRSGRVANLKSCKVLERDPQGRWDVREQVSRAAFLPSVRNVYRSDYDRPNRIDFRRTAGDMEVFEGGWRLESRLDGVRVTYEARASAPFTVPGWIARATLRHDVPAALLALRREATGQEP